MYHAATQLPTFAVGEEEVGDLWRQAKRQQLWNWQELKSREEGLSDLEV